MPAPTASLFVEPIVGGSLVYLPMAPAKPDGKARGRLLVELKITNGTAAALTATTMSITFSGPAGQGASGSRPMNLMILPFTQAAWNLASGSDQFIFDLAAAPTSAVVSVFFAGFSEPVSRPFRVTPHLNPVAGGAYRFPSLRTDLALGEFWQMNGCSHDPGNHQAYAYDMDVVGVDHRSVENGGGSY
jgi:hypothetical protein